MSTRPSNLDILSHIFLKPKEELDIATLLERKPLIGTFRYEMMKQKERKNLEREKRRAEELQERMMDAVAERMQSVSLQEGIERESKL